jgi:hypothetical protein
MHTLGGNLVDVWDGIYMLVITKIFVLILRT